MSDRPTPRTDAAWAKRWDLHDVCPWGLARRLERELADAIKDRDEWKTVAEGRLLESLDEIERLAEAREQRDRLAEHLCSMYRAMDGTCFVCGSVGTDRTSDLKGGQP